VLFTVATSFTNFGDGHRGTKEQAIAAIEASSIRQVEGAPAFRLTVAVPEGQPEGEVVFLLQDPATDEVLLGTAEGLTPIDAEVSATGGITAPGYTSLTVAEASARSEDIAALVVPTEGGGIAAQGFSQAFEGVATLSYDAACDCFTSVDGEVYTADDSQGLFVDDSGEALPQGWQVSVGLANYAKVLTDPVIRDSFFGILVWNLFFATAVVAVTFGLGLLMALALNSPRVRALRTFRALIVLPYAMPAFAMMLLWRDMFNQDFGLINTVLGLDVNWFGEPATARIAVVLVQVWLAYPYMFLVCTGALQAIPAELSEAATIDGAGRFQGFRHVVFPLLLVAVAPLLIASFAFNFNNYNAIALTTDGGPFPPDSPQAGATDLLISYTYRLAFGTAGADYGFAAAVSVFIFLIVAVISLIGFRRTAALEEINRGG
jgi:arabinogalactan oligomer/maltooligosaccharide transport system permease protein